MSRIKIKFSVSAVAPVLSALALTLQLVLTMQPANAQTYTVLYSFGSYSGDGSHPSPGLVFDNQGNLYGTTFQGGANNQGAVFTFGTNGEIVLYSFCPQAGCPDGQNPEGALLRDNSGNLYGSTLPSTANPYGTVFELSPDGTEKVIAAFSHIRKHGGYPNGDLIFDSSGNLYGTTHIGGLHNRGTVFEISANGAEKVLYSFCSGSRCADGAGPTGGLVFDNLGNLYGTTAGGGVHNHGTVFKLAPNGTENTLYDFCYHGNRCADGLNPYGRLLLDSSGNLYGITRSLDGTVFQVTPSGTEKVLYSFCSQSGCPDGKLPNPDLVFDSSGNLYGTTYWGGANNTGAIFEITPSGTEKVLYNFCSQSACSDGEFPQGGLVLDSSGNLYGTTSEGGTFGRGTLFKLTP